jgi:hypothetical protein
MLVCFPGILGILRFIYNPHTSIYYLSIYLPTYPSIYLSIHPSDSRDTQLFVFFFTIESQDTNRYTTLTR